MSKLNKNLIPASLQFDGAGFIEVTRFNADGTLSTDPEDIYTSGPVLAGAIDNKWSKETKEIKDENSEYPGAQRGGTVTATVQANFNTFDPDFDKFTKGATKKIETNFPIRFMNRSYSAAKLADGKYGFVLTEPIDSVSADETVLVRDETTNSDLEPVASEATIADGKFYVDAATKTVYVDESANGMSFYVTYTGIVSEATHYEYPEGRKLQSYHIVLGGYVSDPNGGDDSYWCQKVYDRVALSGDASDPTRQMDPGSYSVTYAVQRPRAGHKAIDVTYVSAPAE